MTMTSQRSVRAVELWADGEQVATGTASMIKRVRAGVTGWEGTFRPSSPSILKLSTGVDATLRQANGAEATILVQNVVTQVRPGFAPTSHVVFVGNGPAPF